LKTGWLLVLGAGVQVSPRFGKVKDMYHSLLYTPKNTSRLKDFIEKNKSMMAETTPNPTNIEIVKAIRLKLLDVALYCGGVDETAQVFQDLRDVCTRLEAAEEKIERLVNLLNEIKTEPLAAMKIRHTLEELNNG